ncbi:MAG TPA: hypothetical protein VK151_02660 [Fluviicola sp.]|nr:hypothetical protein [Fluviicola sp.]
MTTSSATKGLIAISLLFFTIACSSETKTTKGPGDATTEEMTSSAETDTEETVTEEEAITPPKSVKLSGKFLNEDEYGGPHHQVILTVDGKKEIIDTVMACDKISAATYSQYDIPKGALSACGGWWAGGGDYFYAIWEDNKVVVYQGWQDEGQTDTGFHWKAMKR